MNKSTLDNNGTLIFEKDIYDGFIYLFTKKFYLLNNKLYVSEEHSNANRYTGISDTYIVSNNAKKDIETKSCFYWYSLGLNDDALEALESAVK